MWTGSLCTISFFIYAVLLICLCIPDFLATCCQIVMPDSVVAMRQAGSLNPFCKGPLNAN